MNFKEFKQAVKKLAKGEYHTVEHKMTEHSTGEIENEWRAYISGLGYAPASSSPEEALKTMEQMCSDSK